MHNLPNHYAAGSSWAFVRLAKAAWHRAAGGWRALPAGNVRGWLVILVVGWLISAGLSAGLARAGEAMSARGMNAWDERTLLSFAANGPMSYGDAILAESPGNLSYLVPVTLAAAILAALRGRPILAMTVVASYALARPLVLIGWHLWDRARPKLIADGIAAHELKSFPSGHAVLMLAVWGLLAYLWIAASRSWLERLIVVALTLAWVALAGAARVRLGAHWPSDVIAGAVLGLVWLTVVVVALRRGERGATTVVE